MRGLEVARMTNQHNRLVDVIRREKGGVMSLRGAADVIYLAPSSLEKNHCSHMELRACDVKTFNRNNPLISIIISEEEERLSTVIPYEICLFNIITEQRYDIPLDDLRPFMSRRCKQKNYNRRSWDIKLPRNFPLEKYLVPAIGPWWTVVGLKGVV
jgi:hypothetical protein